MKLHVRFPWGGTKLPTEVIVDMPMVPRAGEHFTWRPSGGEAGMEVFVIARVEYTVRDQELEEVVLILREFTDTEKQDLKDE